jgi:hypothetical protein
MPSKSNGNEAMEISALPTQNLEEDGAHLERIRVRAYEICLERGEEPGHELDDWLQAEREMEILTTL